MRLLAFLAALFLLLPSTGMAWDFENAPETAVGGDMPTDQNTPGRSFRDRDHRRNHRPRHRKPQYERHRDKAPHLQRRRYDDRGGVLKDTYNGREYRPGEALPDGGFYDPDKDYD